MNKNIAFLICLITIAIDLQGQKLVQDIHRGDYALEHFNYFDAITFYKESLEKNEDDDETKLKIGECYRKLNDHENAVIWYAAVLESNDTSVDDNYILHYAQSLIADNQREAAEKWFKAYSEKNPEQVVSSNRLNGIEDYNQFYKSSDAIAVQKLAINSPSRDFSPSFYKNGLVFVSDRKDPDGSNKWDNRIFLNLYYSKLSEDGSFYQVEHLSKKLNTSYHEGPLSTYNNGNSIVFTRNNYHKKVLKRSEDGVNKLQLFFAEIDEKENWNNIRKFEHNSDEFSSGHPTINSSGDLLIFSSDRPGSAGGSDLYVSKKEKGLWSEPQNLGSVVNTEGDELFPYLYQDSLLYFSSNGHYGLGGLDLYSVPLKDLTAKSLQNLGAPINSQSDDFGIIVSESGQSGYFSSNRESYENDDIYGFNSIPKGFKLSFTEIDNGKPVEIAGLKIIDEEDNISMPEKRGDDYFFFADGNHDYSLEYEVSNYKKEKVIFSSNGLNTGQLKEIQVNLERIDEYVDNSLVDFPEPDPESIPQELPSESPEPDIEELTLNSVEEEKMVNVIVKPIYFDNDESVIKNESVLTLLKIKEIMKNDRDLKIVIKSYADSNASDDYNIQLSLERSRAVFEYLFSLDIDPERMSDSSYGEHLLVNKCKNGVKCSDQEHALNRRTEFEFKY